MYDNAAGFIHLLKKLENGKTDSKPGKIMELEKKWREIMMF